MSDSGKKTGLGRGLSALLGEQSSADLSNTKGQTPVKLPIDLLQRNPEQPRRRFAEKEMQQLVSSIRKQGVLQPILVRSISGTAQYQIVAGERRWRAASQAGLHEIPVYVRDLSDREVVEVALVENMQRADLNPVEEAQGYRVLIDQFHHTQEDIAKAVARSRSHIANTVRLLDLPDPVQEMLINQELTAGHARTLLVVDNPLALARQVVEGALSVRQTEKLVRQSQASPETKSRKLLQKNEKNADIRALEIQLQDSLGLQVSVMTKSKNKGAIQIEYQSLEQLDDLCRRLNNK